MLLKEDELRRHEHNTVRENVGYYDFTHQLLEVRGKDAADFLDMIFVNSIKKTKIGNAKYTTMLNPEGGIMDDVIVFRMAEDVFHISTLYINELIEWLDINKKEYEVFYRDVTDEYTMYAVQGPKSRTLLNRILSEPVDSLGFYSIVENSIGDTFVYIARSGFTGELGYEIYCAPSAAGAVEETLVANGTDLGLRKITTDVIIGSLPREKGYVLMQDVGGANPHEVGFGWTVAKDKDYIGKNATDRLVKEGTTRALLGFELLEDQEVELGSKVFVDGMEVGKVTSFTYGYTAEKYIGYSLVENPASVGDAAEIGDNRVRAVLTDRVWYDKENIRTRRG